MLILIVEDDALNAFMMEQSLLGAGHHIMGPAGTMTEALALIGQRRPDLALIDIDLGNSTSGLDLARDICTRWDIPGLFVTGQIELARAHRTHALGVLPKPFSPQTLCRTVDYLQARLTSQADGVKPPERLELFAEN
jgi:two-component system, response regulator PdtaR